MRLPEITQQDLKSRSQEIMDALEHGQEFALTRDGQQIGRLLPSRRRSLVSRQQFAARSGDAPGSSLTGFRADQDEFANHEDDEAPD